MLENWHLSCKITVISQTQTSFKCNSNSLIIMYMLGAQRGNFMYAECDELYTLSGVKIMGDSAISYGQFAAVSVIQYFIKIH